MTAHQDVAGVVERLRNPGIRGKLQSIMELRLEAATLIESLSKDLSDAEAERDALYTRLDAAAQMDREKTLRIVNAASRLAEAKKMICDSVSAWEALPEGRYSPRTVEKWLNASMKPYADAARRFLNAGKE